MIVSIYKSAFRLGRLTPSGAWHLTARIVKAMKACVVLPRISLAASPGGPGVIL